MMPASDAEGYRWMVGGLLLMNGGQVAAAVVFKTRHNDERRQRRQDDEMGMTVQISLVADLLFSTLWQRRRTSVEGDLLSRPN
jgi:hypothetical protein